MRKCYRPQPSSQTLWEAASLDKTHQAVNHGLKEFSGLELVVETAIGRLGGESGQPLPALVQQQMESAFGADFSAVRVYVLPEGGSMGVRAFTCGSDIFFVPDWYNPHTAWGQQLLGHELTHVLQQRAGRVNNPCGSGIAVVQDDALETEAVRMGWLAAALQVDVAAKMAPRVPRPHRQAPRSWIGRPERGPSAGRSVVQCAFGKTLSGKTLQYFQGQETGMTYVEFNKLNGDKKTYETIEEVKEALKSLRAPTGTVIQHPSPVKESKVEAKVEALPPAIPGSWTRSVSGLCLYRATDDAPGKIKWQGGWVPLAKNPEMYLPGAIKGLLADPRGYAEGHVRSNYNYVNSCAPEETCCGYAKTRKYVYSIKVPNMWKFEPPVVYDSLGNPSNTMRPPIIWADVPDYTLANAKRLAFDPRKYQPEKGPEIDLIFTIGLNMIDQYKDTTTNKWVAIDWGKVDSVKP